MSVPSSSSAAAPVSARSGRFYRTLRLAVLVPLARLRFLFILGAIGLVIVKWDDLVARYEKYARPAAGADAADPDHEYFCPMHPTVVRDTNKEKCPICFMPLSKRKKGEATDDAAAGRHGQPGAAHPVPGRPRRGADGPGRVPAAARENHDRRHGRVRRAEAEGRVRPGEGADRQALRQPDRADGPQGRPARRTLQPGPGGHRPEPARRPPGEQQGPGGELARDRLKLWGIDDSPDRRDREGRQADHAPDDPLADRRARPQEVPSARGSTSRRAARSSTWPTSRPSGSRPSSTRTTWPSSRPAGTTRRPASPTSTCRSTATTRAFPGKPFTGTLSFLFPHVDPETRTLTVRFELPNPDHELRPGMTATVTLKLDATICWRRRRPGRGCRPGTARCWPSPRRA